MQKDVRRRYQAGIYARLSSDQDEKKKESAGNQVEIARRFVEEYNRQETSAQIDIVECYIDLGKSGCNFDRDGFRKLMQDIRLGKINCVIVKDLSRFGRNYLEVCSYIEKIFPFLGVRFIAVADGFDTGKAENKDRYLVSEVKNLVNDMYAKDFSRKAKLQLKQRREDGSYVGGPPPYGYRAEWDGKRRVLVPDSALEGIVRLIYEKFTEMESYAAVARELNRRRINPPCLYRRTKEVYAAEEDCLKGWDKGAVERIIKSRTYTGTLVQGKTAVTAGDEGYICTPKKDWVVKKDAHEPLIGEELYRKAEEVRERIQARTAARRKTEDG